MILSDSVEQFSLRTVLNLAASDHSLQNFVNAFFVVTLERDMGLVVNNRQRSRRASTVTCLTRSWTIALSET